jgi:hypothetical protein
MASRIGNDAIRNTDEEPDEERPLLCDDAEIQPPSRWANYISMSAMIIFNSTCGTSLQNVPMLQKYEEIICRVYYSGINPVLSQQRDCKVNVVQDELVWLLGWQGFLGTVPGEYKVERESMLESLPPF